MITIDIFCPLYNAEKYLKKLNNSVVTQECPYKFNISYILTDSSDCTEKILKEHNCNYEKISKSSFSHSLVREKAARSSNADIVVFITQDVIINDKKWLINLVKPIVDNEASACYSRQISKLNNIEKYTREYNYPIKSFIKSSKNLKELGLYTFFFSDASSAINRKVFDQLNYYDNKNFSFNEDMYIAYKLIMNNYKICYCANSVVFHSHDFSLKEIFIRYKLAGHFFKTNKYFNKYSANGAGKKLAFYILKRAMQERNLIVLFKFLPNMIARLLGMKIGKIC